MARTAEQVEAEIDSLRANMSKGILRVRHGDVETTFQNMTEMRNWLAELYNELRELNGATIKQVRFRTGKGL